MSNHVDTQGIFDFICAEVIRQGFNIRTPKGFARVAWMLNAWEYAIVQSTAADKPSLSNIRHLGYIIEPELNWNERRWRNGFVRIGEHIAPKPTELSNLMLRWEEQLDDRTPDEAYIEFQQIHPFTDGNGRVGKIIHNWLSRTLCTPILIKDYFGGGNP